MHLRESLKDEAKECGRSAIMQGIEDRLRGHFGITPREARAKLARIKRSSKITLQQHADEIGQLVILGYAKWMPPNRGA